MMEEKLPKGWRLLNLSEVVEILDNLRVPVSSSERAKRVGNIPYYGATGQTGWIDDFIFDEELVLLGEDGAPFFDKKKNVAYLINGKSWVNNHVHVLKANSLKSSNKFIFYFLNHFDYTGFVGGTTRLKLTQGNLKMIPTPTPPLSEQQGIVAKLDALFGHLDLLREKLDRIPGLLKNFRQQVLTQAVTGELTKEWREGKGLGEWEDSFIGDLFEVKTGGTPRRGVKEYYESGTIPWVKSGLVKNQLILEADEFVTELAVKESNVKIFPKDTLLVAMYGEGKTRGQVGWLKIKATTNQAVAALVNEDMPDHTRSYVFYFCLSQYNDIRAKAEGGNQPNLNLSKVKNWEISVPPEEEQKEIVSKVDTLFTLADKIESKFQSLKAKIDQLPQAILAKAFWGELVEQEVKEYEIREGEGLMAAEPGTKNL